MPTPMPTPTPTPKPMSLAELILSRRKQMKLSRMKLGAIAGLSHTEINRIETGDRKMPSLPHMYALADALALPRETVLEAAGCGTKAAQDPIEKAFPALKSARKRETVERIADGLSRGGDMTDEQLEILEKQVEMVLSYIHSQNSQK